MILVGILEMLKIELLTFYFMLHVNIMQSHKDTLIADQLTCLFIEYFKFIVFGVECNSTPQ